MQKNIICTIKPFFILLFSCFLINGVYAQVIVHYHTVDMVKFSNNNYWEDGAYTWIYNKDANKSKNLHGSMAFGTSNLKRMEITHNGNILFGVKDNLQLIPVGRNSDPTIKALSDNWLRIGGGKKGIAMWGNNNVDSTDEPHVLLSQDGTFNVHYNIRALVSGTDGGLYLKNGRNADPTILTHNNQWLRIGGKSGVSLWGNDNADKDDNPTMSIIEGNVGIGMGVNKPIYKLDIRDGAIRTSQNNIEVLMTINNGNVAGWMGTKTNHPLCLGANNGEAIYIDGSQRIYVGLNIGTINNIKAELKNKYDLFVDKGVLSEDYAIAPKSAWADFVFEKEYQLPSLSDVENFITENKHLPNVPSAATIAQEGYSQHEMNKALMQKIEELMLYSIEQNKKIASLEKELNSLKTK